MVVAKVFWILYLRYCICLLMPTENNQCNNLQYYRTALRNWTSTSWISMLGSLVHFLKNPPPSPFVAMAQGGATPSPRSGRASLGHYHSAEAGAAEEQVGWSRFRREGRWGKNVASLFGPEDHPMTWVQSGFWTRVCKSNWGCSPLSKWHFYGL